MENLLEFASLIKMENNNFPVYPLTIFTNQREVRDKIDKNQQRIAKIIDSLHSDVYFEPSSRIDNNVTNGIVRAAEEVVATTIVMGWNKSKTPFNILFGNVLYNLLDKTERMVMVLKTPSSCSQVRKIHLICPENAEYEKGFYQWIDTMNYLIKKLQVKAIVNCSSSQTLKAIKHYTTLTGTTKYYDLQQNELNQQIKYIQNSASELVVFVHSRKQTISYNKSFEQFMNTTMDWLNKNNIIIIYPEQ
jgi:transcriptional regulator with PAS, ATPase and Fis domain